MTTTHRLDSNDPTITKRVPFSTLTECSIPAQHSITSPSHLSSQFALTHDGHPPRTNRERSAKPYQQTITIIIVDKLPKSTQSNTHWQPRDGANPISHGNAHVVSLETRRTHTHAQDHPQPTTHHLPNASPHPERARIVNNTQFLSCGRFFRLTFHTMGRRPSHPAVCE